MMGCGTKVPETRSPLFCVPPVPDGPWAPIRRRAKASAAKLVEQTFKIEATHVKFLKEMVEKFKVHLSPKFQALQPYFTPEP